MHQKSGEHDYIRILINLSFSDSMVMINSSCSHISYNIIFTIWEHAIRGLSRMACLIVSCVAVFWNGRSIFFFVVLLLELFGWRCVKSRKRVNAIIALKKGGECGCLNRRRWERRWWPILRTNSKRWGGIDLLWMEFFALFLMVGNVMVVVLQHFVVFDNIYFFFFARSWSKSGLDSRVSTTQLVPHG
jgi:hypothetical protein